MNRQWGYRPCDLLAAASGRGQVQRIGADFVQPINKLCRLRQCECRVGKAGFKLFECSLSSEHRKHHRRFGMMHSSEEWVERIGAGEGVQATAAIQNHFSFLDNLSLFSVIHLPRIWVKIDLQGSAGWACGCREWDGFCRFFLVFERFFL